MLYRLVAFDEQALEQKPELELSAEDWFLRGVSLIGTDREWSEDEAECYRKAIELREDYVEAHVNLAVLLNARRDAAGAGEHYREALRLRPDSPEAHYNYAVSLTARGSLPGAAEHLREALRLRPEYVDAHHAYSNLLAARGDEAGAAEHYEEALRLRPEAAAVHGDYAILLERVGDLDGATHHYQESLRIRPDPAAHYNYALSLETRGEPTLAELHYREALRLSPDYGEAHNNLAILLQRPGRVGAPLPRGARRPAGGSRDALQLRTAPALPRKLGRGTSPLPHCVRARSGRPNLSVGARSVRLASRLDTRRGSRLWHACGTFVA